jgi:hypothetical protein
MRTVLIVRKSDKTVERGRLHVLPVTRSENASTTSLPVVLRLKDDILGGGEGIQICLTLLELRNTTGCLVIGYILEWLNVGWSLECSSEGCTRVKILE